MYLSGYRCMWVVAMFDLPVDDKAARKRYARFRKSLVQDGFRKMQFSVYIRDCPSRENAEVHAARVERSVPSDGEVRLLMVTDKQFERMRVFWGGMRKQTEAPAPQLSLF
ncbi:MAG: CRISPR-associated endonuclease Cas2 [Phycisphaerales bacterium]|nr:CRISPR-associated endonuclease Cas2 [Phycisphaerales bacterium]